MSGIHLKDLSKVYKEQIAEKKDDSYLIILMGGINLFNGWSRR